VNDDHDDLDNERWTYEPAEAQPREWATPRPGVPPRRPQAPKRRSGASRAVIVLAFVLCVAVVVGAVVGGLRLVRGGGGEVETTSTTLSTEATITVKQGMGATQVGELLEGAGLIESSTDFVDLVKARGSTNSLKPGTYTLTRGQELLALVETLEKGTGAANLKITIPEGLAADQVATLLTKAGKIDGAMYADLAKQPSKFTLPKLGSTTPSVDTLEGLLFPSTYFLIEGDEATELIEAQLAAFQAKTASLPWSNAAELGVTAYEIVIIASMIEKEANIADERAKVAAVIYNRLKEKMSLGIDATVRYALGKWTGALTESDLEVDSPYNTRARKGLPPGPISSPGVAALKAALQPAEADYLYYVLTDTDGHHFFTSSYDEFLQAKENAPQ
jgi:UPF0755 protein